MEKAKTPRIANWEAYLEDNGQLIMFRWLTPYIERAGYFWSETSENDGVRVKVRSKPFTR